MVKSIFMYGSAQYNLFQALPTLERMKGVSINSAADSHLREYSVDLSVLHKRSSDQMLQKSVSHCLGQDQ